MMTHRTKAASRRAMTLIEVTVIGMVGVAMLGVVLGIFIQTSRATDRIMRRDSAVDYARMTLTHITQTLGDALASENLSGLELGQGPSFGAQGLKVLSATNGEAAGLYEVWIGSGESRDEGDGPPVAMTITDVGGGGAAGRNPLANYNGMLPEHCRTGLSFAYAQAAPPGQAPNFQPEWPAGGWPELIRITLTLTLDETPDQPLVFQTAVIPGRLVEAARTLPAITPSPISPAEPAEPAQQPAAAATPAQSEDQE